MSLTTTESMERSQSIGYGFAYFAWIRLRNGYRLHAANHGSTLFSLFADINKVIP